MSEMLDLTHWVGVYCMHPPSPCQYSRIATTRHPTSCHFLSTWVWAPLVFKKGNCSFSPAQTFHQDLRRRQEWDVIVFSIVHAFIQEGSPCRLPWSAVLPSQGGVDASWPYALHIFPHPGPPCFWSLPLSFLGTTEAADTDSCTGPLRGCSDQGRLRCGVPCRPRRCWSSPPSSPPRPLVSPAHYPPSAEGLPDTHPEMH